MRTLLFCILFVSPAVYSYGQINKAVTLNVEDLVIKANFDTAYFINCVFINNGDSACKIYPRPDINGYKDCPYCDLRAQIFFSNGVGGCEEERDLIINYCFGTPQDLRSIAPHERYRFNSYLVPFLFSEKGKYRIRFYMTYYMDDPANKESGLRSEEVRSNWFYITAK